MIIEGVVFWDMLWILFRENEKVVYYCDILKEELCGKVLLCYYYGKKDVLNEWFYFEIDLEMYDYDCVSYELKVIKCKILEFF